MMQIMPSFSVLDLLTAFLGIIIVMMWLPCSICLETISAGRGQTYHSLVFSLIVISGTFLPALWIP